MKHRILLLILTLSLCAGTATAQKFADHWEHSFRLGYNIGGNMPMGLPATIRHLNSYTPQPNPSLGFDAIMFLNKHQRWGIQLGVRIENRGMAEDAQVKNYHMEITRGNQTLAGMFTGDVYTKVTQWGATVPLRAVWRISPKWDLKLGPYLTYVAYGKFEGWAHGGYLRVNDPTGPRVELGETPAERGDYDFSENMRRWQYGFMLGADWHIGQRFGAYADLSWGVSKTFHASFTTIEQDLYPVYLTLGATYRIH